jgi:hypothetical protein
MSFLAGSGRLEFNKAILAYVRYRIDISDQADAASDRGRGSVIRIDGGRFVGDDIGKPVVLRLSDGRLWDCLLEDAEGALVGRSPRGLYRD